MVVGQALYCWWKSIRCPSKDSCKWLCVCVCMYCMCQTLFIDLLTLWSWGKEKACRPCLLTGLLWLTRGWNSDRIGKVTRVPIDSCLFWRESATLETPPLCLAVTVCLVFAPLNYWFSWTFFFYSCGEPLKMWQSIRFLSLSPVSVRGQGEEK